MKTLHLTLKKKWFDMILLQLTNPELAKKEEYREIKPYWVKRLLWLFEEKDKHEISEIVEDLKNPSRHRSYKELFDYFLCEPAYFKSITFKNGYASDAPEIVIESKGIEIREGNPAWGAEEGKKYFVLSLGEILSTKNIKN